MQMVQSYEFVSQRASAFTQNARNREVLTCRMLVKHPPKLYHRDEQADLLPESSRSAHQPTRRERINAAHLRHPSRCIAE